MTTVREFADRRCGGNVAALRAVARDLLDGCPGDDDELDDVEAPLGDRVDAVLWARTHYQTCG